ncbi:MAG: hypothetical protein V3U24_00385 [Candidatus Neomarinimicrobiota bacterium]
MKYFLFLLLGYVTFRLLRSILPRLTRRESDNKDKKASDSLTIREEDIRDAEYKDIDQ